MSFYGNLIDAAAYHLARGNAAWAAAASDAIREAALTRGTDYIDGRYRHRFTTGRWESMFPGERTAGRAQDREWPRTGAADYDGNELPDDAAPIEVEHATYEAALRELVTPGSLSPDYVPAQLVKRRKVGPIEREFFEPKGEAGDTPNRPVIPAIDEIIAPVVRMPYLLPAVTVA